MTRPLFALRSHTSRIRPRSLPLELVVPARKPSQDEIVDGPRSRGDETVREADHQRLIWATYAVSGAAFGLLCAIAFGVGIQAGIASVGWHFMDVSRQPSPLYAFLPSNAPGAWNYRPLVYSTFWLEYRVFGLNPLGYHLVALAGHATAAGLLGAIAFHFSRSQVAMVTSALLFLLSPTAHEPVFDIADLHNALAAPLIFGAILASMKGRGIVAAALTVLAFGVDEYGMLVLPLVIIGRGQWRAVAVVSALYLVLRLVGPGFQSEAADPCRSPQCLATGAWMYATRFAPWVVGSLAVAAMLRRVPNGMTFAIAFLVLTTAFSLVALYPYVADRFAYLPAAGGALMVGLAIAELRGVRLRGAMAIVVIMAIAGAAWLADRGNGWAEAGRTAERIVAETVAANPDPIGPVTMTAPATLAGRHGGISDPFVFHQGYREALEFAYGRPVEVVVERP